MAHFAKIENDVVTQVIVADQEFINSGAVDGEWVATTKDLNAPAGSRAGIGFTYDRDNEVFIAPQPYDSWTLNTTTWNWDAPVPYPEITEENLTYTWDEDQQAWV